MTAKRARLIVKGNVVGVRYRDYVQKIALSHNLKGSVENQPDRTVEIICEGEDKELDKFVSEISKTKNAGKGVIDGYPLAQIDAIEIFHEQPTNKYMTYTIKYGNTSEELGDQMGAAYGVLLEYDHYLGKLDDKYGVISQNINQSADAIMMLANAINSFEKNLEG
jgi:acylphosphatase